MKQEQACCSSVGAIGPVRGHRVCAYRDRDRHGPYRSDCRWNIAGLRSDLKTGEPGVRAPGDVEGPARGTISFRTFLRSAALGLRLRLRKMAGAFHLMHGWRIARVPEGARYRSLTAGAVHPQ